MSKKIRKNLGSRIKELRTNLGFSQQEIAEKLSIPRPSVSQIEKGERDVSAQELARLSEIFGMPMEKLLSGGLNIRKPQKTRSKGDIRITFFRHGEAVDDIYDQYGGWADPDLSPKGISKAYAIAQKLKEKGINFGIIFTSPLKRARLKAEVISRELDIDMKVVQYLKERNTYGLLCGMNKRVVKKRYPELLKAYEDGDYVLGSERYQDFVDRLQLIFEYVKRSGMKDVCCITHGKILKGIISEFLGMKPDSLDDGCMLVVGLDKKGIYYVQSEGISFSK
ncbi:MAG: histidine phosphatase family protein [Patescibacteria group bacterium]|nr:histidine phosphatase family protein [Patescibacteria group bacterium]